MYCTLMSQLLMGYQVMHIVKIVKKAVMITMDVKSIFIGLLMCYERGKSFNLIDKGLGVDGHLGRKESKLNTCHMFILKKRDHGVPLLLVEFVRQNVFLHLSQ